MKLTLAAILLLASVPLTTTASAQTFKDTGDGWCSAHGNYRGSPRGCPGCLRGSTPPSPGLSAAEIERLNREAAEAAAAARLQVEKDRVARENREREEAMKTAVDRAKKVTAEMDAKAREDAERFQGQSIGNQYVSELFKDFSKESLFSRGSKDSAPADLSARRNEGKALAGGPATLEFMGIPATPPPTNPKPRPKPAFVPDPRTVMPDDEDIQFLFDAPMVRSRWPGPRNLGPRLKNPLIEEENKRKEDEVYCARVVAALQAMEDRLFEEDFEKMFLSDVPTEPQRAVVREQTRSVVHEESGRLRTGRRDAVQNLNRELDQIEAAGGFQKGENPMEKEKTDPALKSKIDDARGRVLEKLGREVEVVYKKAAARVKAALEQPEKK